MDWIADPQIWISLLTLTVLEIILGIDNIIFISILSGKLPAEQQRKARKLGLGLALITRVMLLCGLAWVVKLDKPFFEISFSALKLAVSGKDLMEALQLAPGPRIGELLQKLLGDVLEDPTCNQPALLLERARRALPESNS